MSNTNKPLTVTDLIDYLSFFEPTAIVKIGGAYDQYYSPVTKDMVELVQRPNEYFLLIREIPE